MKTIIIIRGMTHVKSCLFLMTISLVTLFLLTPVAKAQSSCAGVDLVFIVDNSGSMERNDPGNLRVDAVRFAVDGLGNNILYDCPSAIHRLAIVGFGDAAGGGQDTEIYLDNAMIAPQLEEFRAWVATREQYKAAIPKSSPSMGATDFLSAFQTASEILARWQEQPPSSASRLRGVVLVADGGPCVIDLGCTDSTSMNVQSYLADLEAYLDSNGDVYPWRGSGHPDSVQIWFIAFNDTGAGAAYNYLNPDTTYGQMLLRSWNNITQGHGGYMVSLRSSGQNDSNANRDIGLRVAEIVDEITGSELIPTTCNEPFYVNPYLGRTIIRILKIGSNPDVPLESVKVDVVYEGPGIASRFVRGETNGEAGLVSDYRADGPNEYYVIENPAPGTWRIEVEGADECRDLDVRYSEISFEGQVIAPATDDTLPQYDEGDNYDPNDPLYFEYQLYRRPTEAVPESEVIMSLPEFPLAVTVNITNPNQSVQRLTLEQQSNGNWHSTDPIKTAVAGQYRWSLAAQALNGEQSEVLTRFPDNGSFNVKAVNRFHIEMVEPEAQTTLPLNDFKDGTMVTMPVRVLAKVIDETTGQVLSQDAIAATPMTEPLLNVIVDTAAGASQPVAMVYDATLGGWVVDLLAGQNGVPAIPGSHVVKVQLNRDAYNQEQYRPAVQNGSSSAVTIVRTIVMDGTIRQPQATTPIPQFDDGEQFDPEAPVFMEYGLHGWDTQSADNGLTFSQFPVQLQTEIYFDDRLHQTFALTKQDDGNWRSAEPLKVPYVGEYRWKLTAEPVRAEDKELIIGFTREGIFTVSKVGRFHFELLEPQANVYPINRFRQGQQEILPLTIAVALVDDESGTYLAPEQLSTVISKTPTLSATIELNGVQSQPIPVIYNPTSKRWEASVVAGDNGVPEAAGHYTLQVNSRTMIYDKTRYRPSARLANPDAVQFERTVVTPVMLQVEPEAITQSTHEGSMACIDAIVKPLQIRVQALNAQTKQLLDPMEITGDKGSLLAFVSMINPTTNLPLEEGSWELMKMANGVELQASLGMTYTQSGRYAIQIVPNPAALADNFQFMDAEGDLLVAVNRTYTLWNDPKTCQSAKTTGASVLAVFFLWMGTNWWRRPTGYLQVVESRSGNTVAEQQLGRSPLLLLRPKQSLKFNSDLDIAKLVVQQARGDQADYADPFAEQSDQRTGKRIRTRAVKVTVYDLQNQVLLDPILTPNGEPYPISSYLEVRYS